MVSSPWVDALVKRLAEWLPADVARVAIAAVVVIVGYLLARVIRYVVTRFFRRLSDRILALSLRASRRAGLSLADETETPGATTAIDVSGRVVFWLVFAVFLGAATTVLGIPVLSSWLEKLAAYLPRVLAAAAVVLLGVLTGLFVRIAVTAVAGAYGETFARSLGRGGQIAVVALAAVVAVAGLGIEVTFLVVMAAIVLGAMLGGAALAFGLGARTSVANLLACHYLGQWYRVGQVVRIGDLEGRIAEILPSAVILHTDAGKRYIPAQEFAENSSLLVAGKGNE